MRNRCDALSGRVKKGAVEEQSSVCFDNLAVHGMFIRRVVHRLGLRR